MDDQILAIVNITTPDGELLGRVELTADDLSHPSSIGSQVIAELPADIRNKK